MAQQTSTHSPDFFCASSTSLMLEELISSPTTGARFRLKNKPLENKIAPDQRPKPTAKPEISPHIISNAPPKSVATITALATVCSSTDAVIHREEWVSPRFYNA